jgi:hypothetical protein
MMRPVSLKVGAGDFAFVAGHVVKSRLLLCLAQSAIAALLWGRFFPFGAAEDDDDGRCGCCCALGFRGHSTASFA